MVPSPLLPGLYARLRTLLVAPDGSSSETVAGAGQHTIQRGGRHIHQRLGLG
jgi:hypothetical protein